MNILIYGPFYSRPRDVESLMFKFIERGHSVYLLTTSDRRGPVMEYSEKKGVHVYLAENKFKSGIPSLLFSIYFLLKFIKQHKIQLVFSHLESNNFTATMAGFFTKARIVINRHHSDDFVLNGWSSRWDYRMTNHFCKECIVYSDYAKQVMVEQEGMSAAKIRAFKLSYDFSLYDAPNAVKVAEIKASAKGLVLLTVGRLVKYKRTEEAILVLNKLRYNNIEATLIIVGDGEEKENLSSLINQLNLQNHCIMTGRVDNVMDYISACDVLLHPSVSESSCVVVKEAGLESKIVIANKAIGDFDAYLEHGVNSFIVHPTNFVDEAVLCIQDLYQDPQKYVGMGPNLKADVYRLFDIKNNFSQYERYLQ